MGSPPPDDDDTPRGESGDTIDASHPDVAGRPWPDPAPAVDPDLPVGHWDRYEVLGLLGKGGMGAVYKARDRLLGRLVALKFILGNHPATVMRFVQEARAQARVEHPNVCRVLEVGEHGGRAYIAMQFVDGEQLAQAALHLSRDQLVRVLCEVAEAIHEAHKLGIVHRDLKPANIMVERTEDGRWVPMVMDFGLAREVAAEDGLTQSGALLGTPAYMSPEQARGEHRAVDRRSDVYSLGATLYQLLTGRPPFTPAPLALALEQVLHQEPVSPRSWQPHLPVDLETITLKCLAKEPERRYASARSLADDLRRYLDGEPILGQRPSLWQTVRRRARRHRALVAVIAASTLMMVALGAAGLRTRAHAAERARLAQRLGQDANELRWLWRAAVELPLHDIGRERSLIRARMQRMATVRHGLGALGDATVHEALGRAHVALHEWADAARELQRAADAGLDTPALHAARGRALGELYHRAVEDARRAGDRGWLAGRLQALERQYLAPALAELEASRGGGDASGDDPALLEALLALYRHDYARAEERALAAAEATPWDFEARRIAADAAYDDAVAKVDHGAYDDARARLERATQRYDEAAAIARSDGSLYEAAARAWLERAEIDARQSRSPREPIDRALERVAQALQADPRDAGAHTTKTYVLLRWFHTPALRSGDQRVFLDDVAAAARRATELDPSDANAWDALGNAHAQRGEHEEWHGGDPRPWLERAQTELERAIALQPGHPWAHNDLGVVHRWLGNRIAELGQDPMAEFQAALRSYERATTIDPEYVYARSNQADLAATIAAYQVAHGVDPSAAVTTARQAGERCLAIDGKFYMALDRMAQAEVSLAEFLVDTGGDPAAALAAARAHIDRAVALHPDHVSPYLFRQRAAIVEARRALATARDPAPALAAARAALSDALRWKAECAVCYVAAAQADVVEADAAIRIHRPAGAALDRALADATRAAGFDAHADEARRLIGEAYLRRAVGQSGTAARASLRTGLAAVDAALALAPGSPRAHALRAALLQRQSDDPSDRQASAAAVEAARVEQARAVELNPLSARK